MAERPPKRQKRLIVLSSDDEDNAEQPVRGASVIRKSPRTSKPIRHGTDAIPAPVSPSRGLSQPASGAGSTQLATTRLPKAKKGKIKKNQKGSKKPIFSFFNASTERQRSPTSQSRQSQTENGDDIIVDDHLDEDLGHLENWTSANDNRSSEEQQRPLSKGADDNQSFADFVPPSAAPAFVKAYRIDKKDESTARIRAGKAGGDGNRPWADKYAPTDLSELAVHKKKVADVREWLGTTLAGRGQQRVLILKGPAGTGKTTTVSLLSNDMGLDILEWRNPIGSDFSSEGFTSMSARFDDFLGRGRTFGGLDIVGASGSSPAKSHEILGSPVKPEGKKIILIEEFPSTFTRSSNALQMFRSSILQHLASTSPISHSIFSQGANQSPSTAPLIMIISETLLTTNSAAADSFTAHRLLGPQILQHPGVHVIEFNAIARTLMTKALELVIRKEAKQSGRHKMPGNAVLEALGQVGDVRSAVGSLEFMCVRAEDGADWGGKVAVRKSKKAPKEQASSLTEMEKESLEMVTQREASLGIFHAVGKVVYNKRDDVPPSDDSAPSISQPPEHLAHQARLKKSQVSVNELIDETGTDTSTFISTLHENYVLSCEAGSAEASSLEILNGCIDALSDSDVLSPKRDSELGRSNLQGAGADSLRQDEISFHVSVRGLLFNLPSPVKRRPPPPPPPPLASNNRIAQGFRGSDRQNKPTGGRGDAYKMYFPTSLRIWRLAEETESMLDMWMLRFLKGEILAGAVPSLSSGGKSSGKGTVESWKQSSNPPFDPPPDASNDSSPSPAAPITTITSRHDILLHVLPFAAKILIPRTSRHPGATGVKAQSLPQSLQQELSKLTAFYGSIGIQPSDDLSSGDDDHDDHDALVGQNQHWATDTAETPSSRETQRKGVGPGGTLVASSISTRHGNRAGKDKGDEREQLLPTATEKLVLSDDDIEDD